MGRLARMLATRGGAALLIAVVIAGASIAYAAIRSTTSLDASFVAIEATYGLSIIDRTGDAQTSLAFGNIVQGEASRASFGVQNDGNTRAKLGFRVQQGDNIFPSSGDCAVSRPNRTAPAKPEITNGARQDLRTVHEEFHKKLGELDTPEEKAKHEKFHKALEKKIKDLQGNVQGGKPPAQKLSRVRGHSVDVPGLAKFCFAVASAKLDSPLVLGPGRKAGVVVTLRTDPQVAIQEHQFKILVDSNDLSGQ